MPAPDTAWNDQMFERDVLNQNYFRYLSQNTQEELRKLWEEAREDILRREITVMLLLERSAPKDYRKQEIPRLFLITNFPPDIIQQTLRYHGYSSLDECIESVGKNSKTRADDMQKAVEPAITIFSTRWNQIVNDDIVVQSEVEKIKAMCLAQGIGHRDFDDRNIVMEWDFENDKPLRRDDKPPKLWIVD